MALNLERKKAITREVNALANDSLSLVSADYRGLTSPEMTTLRANARKSGVYLQVVRNTLAVRAFKETKFECMEESLLGPLILAFSKEEPGAGAKLFQAFAKQHDKLQVKALSLGETLLSKDQLAMVASLPTREEALSRLLGTLQAPITKFVRTLAEPQAKLVRVLAAVKEKKQANA